MKNNTEYILLQDAVSLTKKGTTYAKKGEIVLLLKQIDDVLLVQSKLSGEKFPVNHSICLPNN
jgi:hypothetical protein